MSRKASQPQTSPQAGGNVDFLVRTMIERESSGKRPIKPKNVEDLLQSTMQDESDDPDFDCKDEDSDSEGTGVSDDDSSSGSSNDKDNKNAEDSDESDDEDYVEKEENSASSTDNEGTDSDSSDSSNDESDDEPEIPKKSALRETLEKLNETNNFVMKRPNKRKRKKKANDNSNAAKASSKSGSSKKSKTDAGNGKSKSKQSKSKLTKQASKISKNKKGVIVKKSKVARKKEALKKKKKVKKTDEKSKSRQRSIANLVDSMTANQKENRNEIAIDMKKPICSACLGDKSDDANEIVECDSCGISVHESCYMLSADNVSVSSGSGSSSCTEPWFCDVCKSGSENISCELCPVEGGLFKESTAGRWVHLVCAMYTQGVALHNDSTINLFEIPYSRWGSHNCAACEYERLAHAGIVIRCDAGLCKTYFHATCAQKLGLLSDPTQCDFAEADPYFVSCKLHTAREVVKRKIRIFNALQEQLRIKRERKELIGLPSAANGDHARIFRKLEKVRQKTALKRAHYLASVENLAPQSCSPDQLVPSSLPSSWTSKKHRLMHTSAKLGNDFLKKSECLGEDINALELEVKHEKIFCNVRRKWNVLPAMSVEYAAYYSDRENRISNLIDQCDKAAKENKELIDKEEHMKDVVETIDINHDAMKEETASVSRQLESLVSLITFVCPTDKKIASKFQSLLKSAESASGRRKSPSTSRGDKKSPSRRSSTTTKKAQKNRVMSPSPSRPGKLALPVCVTCSKSTQQHLITRCDKCKEHYHLGCLDPPLTRMPKRSRLCGWMCSDCCDAPSEAEGHVDTEAPRTLRGRTKIRKPGKYRGSDESEEDRLDFDNKVVVAKKSQAKPNSSLDFPETEVDPLPAQVPVANTSPPAKRRRSESVTASVPVLLNATESPKANDNMLPSSVLQLQHKSVKIPNLDTLGGEVSAVAEPKAPKKRKSSLKLPKPQRPKLQQGDAVLLLNSSEKPAVIASPKSKRKSAEVPLTTTSIKVNGISETTLTTTTEDADPVVPISKKKKSKKSVVSSAVVDNLSKNGIAVLDKDAKVDQVKKKPKSRMKKELVEGKIQQSVILASSNITSENNSLGVVKPKKPKKKANKVDLSLSLNEGSEITNSTQPPEKKAKKRPAKSKLPVQSTNLVARDETTGVDRDAGKVTSQMQQIASKMTENQNGTVKIPTQKRKKSATNASTVNTVTLISSPVIAGQKGTPDEKEKCIPPKKRKRAPSNAQQQNPTIDSIIDAVVSSGQISNCSVENGHRDLNSKEGSTITMQGISPNRQLAPEQNIMQGKQMGSNPGVSSGETVTVDASFIIDGPTSNHSSFSGNASNPMFYSSSNHITSTGSAQEDSAMMKLAGMGREGFQVANSTNSSENVIRLQYMDSEAEAPSSSVPDSVAMPPPLNPNSNGVCATCIKNDNRGQLVMCDKCRLEFHFTCLSPGRKDTPRKKGCPWFCKNCDDEIESLQENGFARQPH